MDPSFEIRKLLPSQLRELASILETHDLWKDLMSIIPKKMDKYDYQCDISSHNHPQYNPEYFRLIQSESEQSRRTCTEVLFEEWGTSGRNRPALGHLLYLLKKANLFRAADYVAVNLLHLEKPERPDIGPAAEIPIDLSDVNKTSNGEFKKEQPVTVNKNVPNLSILNLESRKASTQLSEEQNLLIQDSSESGMIPDLESLQRQSCAIIEDSSNLPDLSALQISILNLNLRSLTLSKAFQAPSENTKTRSCSSRLPILSLDTTLPHFSYQILELATNSFKGRLLGKGDFGSVFLATNLLGKPVAVKKLDIGNVDIVKVDDEVTKQFRNEVEVLSKYKHENLLSLLGYSCDGYTYCLLYEYMPGGTLRDRLQDVNNQLLWKERLNVAVGTSKAICYLHTAYSSPLIHRDINSANILLDSNNQPKLGDFGLIKLIPNQDINTATTVFGTSAYMPREAFGGDISVKFDTFSFGVVLLELLTSLPPIDSKRDGVDLVTHIGETIENDEIASIVDYKAGSWIENAISYAEKLYTIAQSCLKEKKKRPTMMEVKMVLERMFGELQ